MSDDDLPVHLNLLTMDPNTTSQPSTPPSPSSVAVFMEMAARAGIDVSEETTATTIAIQQQEEEVVETVEEPHDVPIPESPAYHPHSPTPEPSNLSRSSRETTPDSIPDLFYPGPEPVHHTQINIPPDMPAWPWKDRHHLPQSASLPYRLMDHRQPELLDYVRLSLDSISNEPTTISTTGKGEPQYATPLFASPVLKDPSNTIAEDLWQESPLGTGSAFDPVLNKALWMLKDAGVWADVLRMRGEDARATEFQQWDARIRCLEDFALAEQCGYIRAKEQSWAKRKGASDQLIAACATTCILRVIQTFKDTNDFKRRMEYMHTCRWMLPRIRASQGPTSKPPTQTPSKKGSRSGPYTPRNKPYVPRKPKCSLCNFKGHTTLDCETPHYKCVYRNSGFCYIRPTHPYYKSYSETLKRACPYNGAQPVRHGKGKSREAPIDVDEEELDQGSTLYDLTNDE